MLSKIRVIGIDLDGTLYPDTPEIQRRVRTKIYEKISKECCISYDRARDLFEENYAIIKSGSKTVTKIAREYEKEIDGGDIIQEALQEADILDLIEENPGLDSMLHRIVKVKELDLLTSSEHNLALQKLSRLDVDRNIFSYFLAYQEGSKTTGEKYKEWLSKRELRPEQHLYVGDNTKLDIDIPKSLGIKTCIVGSYDAADFQIQDILDLETLLD